MQNEFVIQFNGQNLVIVYIGRIMGGELLKMADAINWEYLIIRVIGNMSENCASTVFQD